MALTKTPIELSSTPSIVDGGNATAITIDSSENVTISGNVSISHGAGDSLTLTKTTTEPSLRIEGDTNKDFVITVSNELLTITQNDGSTDLLTLDHDTKAATLANGLTLTDGNLVVANGHGIDFSANANAAGMTSELLDDYEEGTWTMTLGTSSGNATITSGNTTGNYTKVGNLVTLNVYNAGSNVSAAGSGSPRIGGFPFPIAIGNGYYACASFSHTDIFATTYSAYGAVGNTFAQVTQVGSAAAASFATGNPKYLMFSITYMTTA